MITIATLLGCIWILVGVTDVMWALSDTSLESGVPWTIAGLASVVGGVAIVSWPEPTLTVVVWIAGTYLLLFSVFMCAASLHVRESTSTPDW